MLINKRGFRAFNEYDLRATLEAQLSRVRDEVDSRVRSSPPDNKEAFIQQFFDKYKVQPLEFNPEGLTVTTEQHLIPAEYFSHAFFVEPSKKYPKQVLTFHLPYSGDEQLLHCVPSARIMWTEEILSQQGEVLFDVINFSDDADSIKAEKDKVVKYLVDQAANVNSQIYQHNAALQQSISDAIGHTLDKVDRQSDLLSKIGVPLRKTDSPSNQQPSRKAVTESDKQTKKFDVFICHASEDKKFVKKLADALKKEGIEVWYDDFQLGWGDDLRPAIDNGLKNSSYGIVVFSKSFLAKKKWTEYELNGLFAREKLGKKVILPVWHDIEREELAQYSPSLADRLAKNSDSVKDIVSELKKLLGK